MIQLARSQSRPNPEALGVWWKQIEEWRRRGPRTVSQEFRTRSSPQYVIRKLRESPTATPSSPPMSASTQMWARSTIGFCDKAPLAQLRRPGTIWASACPTPWAPAGPPRTQVACDRQASIQMNIQELSICKQFRLPIKICNLNNRYLGMVRQWQELGHGGATRVLHGPRCPILRQTGRGVWSTGIRQDRPSPMTAEGFPARTTGLPLTSRSTQTEKRFNLMVQGGKGLTEMMSAE